MLKIKLLFLILFLSLWGGFPAHASKRTVFVQLFEWPWADIARECELYLGPAGFSAVQVSPPQEHIETSSNAWWERYQVVSYKISSRGGTEKEFAEMIRRCKNAGVDVYADAVLNHMTGVPDATGSAGTRFTHFNYPGLYSENDFHRCGRNGNNSIVNFNDLFELQNCELVGLADLATESPYVQSRMAEYLNHLVDLGVAGFRIDAAKHMPAKDLATITGKIKKPSYIFQEVIYDPQGPIKYSDYTPVGDVTAYDYPYRLGGGVKGRDLNVLLNIGKNLPASTEAIVFVTNHDLERSTAPDLLSFTGRDQKLYRLAQIFMLAWPYGYPQVYSGYSFSSFDQGPPLESNLRTKHVLTPQNTCQSPWTCEHRLPEVAAMVDFRNQTDKEFFIKNWWSNGHDQLSFSRGTTGFVAINFSNKLMSKDFQTNLPKGNYCNIVDSSYSLKNLSCPQTFTVDANGILHGTLQPQSALVLLNRNSFLKK